MAAAQLLTDDLQKMTKDYQQTAEHLQTMQAENREVLATTRLSVKELNI